MNTFPIISKLGGREATFSKLQSRGFDKGLDALRMWHSRRRIPGDAITLLMKTADEEGIEYSAADFEFCEDREPEAAHA